jgi:ABC-type nitrate/sulfonate/bicarbonate transport system substrate-binding protein
MTAKQGGYWPIYIGQDMGFFANHGINLDIVITQKSSTETEAVLSGSLDVSSGTPDGFLIALAKGQSTEAIFALRNAPSYSLIAASGIQHVSDLKGKLIGVSAVTSSDAFFVKQMLANDGLSESDYSLIAIGGTPARVAALQSGAIQAALIDQPQDFALISAGFGRLGLSIDVVKDYAWAWGVVRSDWAAANQDAVVRFLKALRQSVTWFYDPANRQQAIDILVRETGVSADDASSTYDIWSKSKELVPDSAPSPTGLQALESFMTANGQFSGLQAPAATQFINVTYLNQASQ